MQSEGEIEVLAQREKEKFARETQYQEEIRKKNEELNHYKMMEQKIRENNWDINTLATHKNSMAEDPITQVKLLQQEIADMKKQHNHLSQSLSQREELMNISKFISQNSEKYELIQKHGLEKEVQNLIEFKKNENVFLTFDQAADELEKHIEKIAKEQLKIYKNNLKLKNEFGKDTPESNVSRKTGADTRKAETPLSTNSGSVPAKSPILAKNRDDFWNSLKLKYKI